MAEGNNESLAALPTDQFTTFNLPAGKMKKQNKVYLFYECERMSSNNKPLPRKVFVTSRLIALLDAKDRITRFQEVLNIERIYWQKGAHRIIIKFADRCKEPNMVLKLRGNRTGAPVDSGLFLRTLSFIRKRYEASGGQDIPCQVITDNSEPWKTSHFGPTKKPQGYQSLKQKMQRMEDSPRPALRPVEPELPPQEQSPVVEPELPPPEEEEVPPPPQVPPADERPVPDVPDWEGKQAAPLPPARDEPSYTQDDESQFHGYFEDTEGEEDLPEEEEEEERPQPYEPPPRLTPLSQVPPFASRAPEHARQSPAPQRARDEVSDPPSVHLHLFMQDGQGAQPPSQPRAPYLSGNALQGLEIDDDIPPEGQQQMHHRDDMFGTSQPRTLNVRSLPASQAHPQGASQQPQAQHPLQRAQPEVQQLPSQQPTFQPAALGHLQQPPQSQPPSSVFQGPGGPGGPAPRPADPHAVQPYVVPEVEPRVTSFAQYPVQSQPQAHYAPQQPMQRWSRTAPSALGDDSGFEKFVDKPSAPTRAPPPAAVALPDPQPSYDDDLPLFATQQPKRGSYTSSATEANKAFEEGFLKGFQVAQASPAVQAAPSPQAPPQQLEAPRATEGDVKDMAAEWATAVPQRHPRGQQHGRSRPQREERRRYDTSEEDFGDFSSSHVSEEESLPSPRRVAQDRARRANDAGRRGKRDGAEADRSSHSRSQSHSRSPRGSHSRHDRHRHDRQGSKDHHHHGKDSRHHGSGKDRGTKDKSRISKDDAFFMSIRRGLEADARQSGIADSRESDGGAVHWAPEYGRRRGTGGSSGGDRHLRDASKARYWRSFVNEWNYQNANDHVSV